MLRHSLIQPNICSFANIRDEYCKELRLKQPETFERLIIDFPTPTVQSWPHNARHQLGTRLRDLPVATGVQKP
jgi:hypothetical protein